MTDRIIKKIKYNIIVGYYHLYKRHYEFNVEQFQEWIIKNVSLGLAEDTRVYFTESERLWPANAELWFDMSLEEATRLLLIYGDAVFQEEE